MKRRVVISAIFLIMVSVCVSAQTDTLAFHPNKARKLAKFTAANLCNFGIGLTVEGMFNYGLGLRYEWRLGSERQLFNLLTAAEIKYFNPVKNARRHPYIVFGQFSPSVGLRMNCLRLPSGSIYLEGDGIYNMNFLEEYHTSNRSISDSRLARHHFSTAVRMGYVTDNIDVGLWAKYSLKPTFDQKYIYESPTYDYDAMGPAINERWIIGLCLVFYPRI